MLASDLFLSPGLPESEAQQFLSALGFRDPPAADRHLRAMVEDVAVRHAAARVADELLEALRQTPDPDAALVGFARYLAARSAKAMFLDYLRDDPRALRVLALVLGTSPFLGGILVRHPEYLHWLLQRIDRDDPIVMEDEHLVDAALAAGDAALALDTVKRFKHREILAIAARDLLGVQPLEATTAQLSDLAGLVVDRALAIVTRQLAARGAEPLPGAFAVIGMGKLGGRELNYSSDIDVLYVYDADDRDESRAHEVFHRLARMLTAALGEHTGEGYLYRVDLRLRPMGRRGNIAYDLRQYAHYYETWGETFERLALIKARPVAGDHGLGGRFVSLVQPFVYRKYLDHAALEEMFRYKARTEQATREADRNVKVGRGGIREIELFAQILQLTYGGATPALRQHGTLAALDALDRARLVPAPTADELKRAYVFLRTVEHRLQIVHEGQTHTLSDEATELGISARRLGLESAGELDHLLREHRDRVHGAFAGLLARARGAGGLGGRQLFRMLAGDLAGDEALGYLRDGGFRDPAAALRVVTALAERTFDAPVRSTARNVLANLLAVWLPEVARCTRPERVLTAFEQFAVRSGVSTELYRTLLENDGLRRVLTDVLDAGELLARRLVRYPELLDALLRPAASLESLARSVGARLAEIDLWPPDDRARAFRRFKQSEELWLLVRWLAGDPLADLHERLSLLASRAVEQAARWHAPAEPDADARWTIVALGKLGSRELGVHSDLDLVVLYDGDPSDAARFVRYQSFVERTVAFLEQPTSEPPAYRIDTRLRPEGSKGALAMPTVTLARYFEARAEPWERLAWTRARAIGGSAASRETIRDAVERFVYGPWDPALPGYMHAIRTRMERELAREAGDRVDFKLGRGGLADIDFLVQLVQIREGRERRELRAAGTRAFLDAHLPTPYITGDETVALRDAYAFLRRLETVVRLDADASTSTIGLDAAALAPIGGRFGFADHPGERLAEAYRTLTARVRATYTSVLDRLA